MVRFFVTLGCVVLLCACNGDGDGNGDGGSGSGAGFGAGFGGSGGGNAGGSGAMCQSFSPCGGSIDGTWRVQDICVEDALSLAGMATDEPACRDLFRSVQTGGSGTITFQSGTVTSNALLTVEMNAVWTVPCLMAASGVQNLDLATTCTNIGQNYAMNPDFSASACKVAGQTCDCTVELEQDFALPAMYTLAGSAITFEGDSSVTTYCVSGNTLSISNMDTETSGTLTLTRP
jgi:hypothetical protein